MTVVATGRLVHEALAGGRRGRARGDLRRGARPAHAPAARRGGDRRVGQEDEPLRRRARGGRPHGLRRRDRGDRPGAVLRLPRRAGRARRREVHAAPVRARDGGVRHPARGRRARRDQADGRQGQYRPMASQVTLPRLGQGMESGTIVRWLKAEGDTVEKGEPLYELDTEKVTQEVEADVLGRPPQDPRRRGRGDRGRQGRRRHRRGRRGGSRETARAEPEGSRRPRSPKARSRRRASRGARARGRARARSRPRAAEAAEASRARAVAGAHGGDGGRVKASPLARRIAKERGIDLSSLHGTGPEGRIVAEDVERAERPPPRRAGPQQRLRRRPERSRSCR